MADENYIISECVEYTPSQTGDVTSSVNFVKIPLNLEISNSENPLEILTEFCRQADCKYMFTGLQFNDGFIVKLTLFSNKFSCERIDNMCVNSMLELEHVTRVVKSSDLEYAKKYTAAVMLDTLGFLVEEEETTRSHLERLLGSIASTVEHLVNIPSSENDGSCSSDLSIDMSKSIEKMFPDGMFPRDIFPNGEFNPQAAMKLLESCMNGVAIE